MGSGFNNEQDRSIRQMNFTEKYSLMANWTAPGFGVLMGRSRNSGRRADDLI
jgi:hypothetical protein